MSCARHVHGAQEHVEEGCVVNGGPGSSIMRCICVHIFIHWCGMAVPNRPRTHRGALPPYLPDYTNMVRAKTTKKAEAKNKSDDDYEVNPFAM